MYCINIISYRFNLLAVYSSKNQLNCVFAPNDETDPKFGKIIREAAEKGVELYAYKMKISPSFSLFSLSSKLDVLL